MSHSKYSYRNEHQYRGHEEQDENFPWHYYEQGPGNASYLRNLVNVPDIALEDKHYDKQAYLITLKLGTFYPDGVSLKQQDRNLIIECKHEERATAGCWETCHVVRTIQIPEDVEMHRAQSWMSRNGTLTVLAPINVRIIEHYIPIKFESRLPVPTSQPRYQMNTTRDPRSQKIQEAQYRMEAALRFQSIRNYYPTWSTVTLEDESARRKQHVADQLRQFNEYSQRQPSNYVSCNELAIPLPYPRNINTGPVAKNTSYVVICSTRQEQEGTNEPKPAADAASSAPRER